MKTVRIALPLGKINTGQLHSEIAAKLKVPGNTIGISVCNGGSGTRTTVVSVLENLKVSNEDGTEKEVEKPKRITVEERFEITPALEVHLPDELTGVGIEEVVLAHVPKHDDRESLTLRLAKEEEEKIANHPLFKSLKADVEALKAKSKP